MELGEVANWFVADFATNGSTDRRPDHRHPRGRRRSWTGLVRRVSDVRNFITSIRPPTSPPPSRGRHETGKAGLAVGR